MEQKWKDTLNVAAAKTASWEEAGVRSEKSETE
jgi:hypothetical protein